MAIPVLEARVPSGKLCDINAEENGIRWFRPKPKSEPAKKRRRRAGSTLMPNCTGDTFCNACGKHWDGPCYMPEGWAMSVDWHENRELAKEQASRVRPDSHTIWRLYNTRHRPDQR